MNKKLSIVKGKKKYYNENKIRIILISFFCIIAIFQSGLRDINKLKAGNDTVSYYYLYFQTSDNSWSQLFQQFSFYTGEYEARDFGFPIFVKFTQLIVVDFTFFMFIVAAIFLIPFSMLIYRYVKTYLGIILAYSLYFGLFTIIVNGIMRQAISLGIVLFGVRYIINSDWKKYFTLLFCAFSIHSSAIIAVPLFFMPKFITTRKWLFLALILQPFFIVYSSSIIRFIASGTVYEAYGDGEEMKPINYVILLVFAFIFTIVYYKKIITTKNCELLISGIIGTVFLLPLVWKGGTLLRISYYYSIFIIPLLPVILDNINLNKDVRNFAYIAGISFFSYFIFR